jgi:hypothetical protein
MWWSVIYEFICFWGRCFKQGFVFAWSTFGVFNLACAGVAGFLYWLKKSHQRKWETEWEPKVRETVFIIFVATLVISVFGVAPFLQMRDTVDKTKLSAAIVEHDVPYESVTNLLFEANKKVNEEKKRADKEHDNFVEQQKRSQNYQARYIEALSATNASPNSDTVASEIAILEHERSLLSPTNSDYYRRMYQNKTMLGSLEAKNEHLNEVETLKNRLSPIYPLWVMAFTTFQTTLDGYARKYGGKASDVAFPTLDDLVNKGAQQNTTLNITVGTNFVRNGCCVIGMLEHQTSLEFSLQGPRASPTTLAFWVTPYTDSQLHVVLGTEKVQIILTNCLISSKADCVKLVNDAMEVLMQAQVESETTAK